jgi:hypothetical protein
MAFTAKQKMYNFAKPKKAKKRSSKKIQVVRAEILKNPKRRPITKKIPVAREVIVIQSPSKGSKLATKTKRRKSRKTSVKRTAKVATRRRRSAVKTVRRRARRTTNSVRRVGRRVHRGLVKSSGGLITANKKESLINLACIGAGFIGSMALMNLAPLPAQIKNLKWKGGILAVGGVLLALKVRDKKARLALAGMAVYGIVDVLKTYIPQLASLSGYDSQRALVLSGAVQSRGRAAVGGNSGRMTAVGYTHKLAPAPQHPNRAMVTGASNYRTSESSFV